MLIDRDLQFVGASADRVASYSIIRTRVVHSTLDGGES